MCSTTVYRKTYRPLSSDQRYKIWHENIQFRFDQRLRNLQHQCTWKWACEPGKCVSPNNCDCQGDGWEEDGLPLPKNRIKHLYLNERYSKNLGSTVDTAMSRMLVPRTVDPPALPVQPTEEISKPLPPKSASAPQVRRKDVGIQTTSRKPPCPHRPPFKPQTKGPFLCFGRTCASADIGTKKTFNVLAPMREVHPRALLARRMKGMQ